MAATFWRCALDHIHLSTSYCSARLTFASTLDPICTCDICYCSTRPLAYLPACSDRCCRCCLRCCGCVMSRCVSSCWTPWSVWWWWCGSTCAAFCQSCWQRWGSCGAAPRACSTHVSRCAAAAAVTAAVTAAVAYACTSRSGSTTVLPPFPPTLFAAACGQPHPQLASASYCGRCLLSWR